MVSKYQVICCGVTVQACDTLSESIVYFKQYAKKFGLDNVSIVYPDDNIQTIKLIIVKE